MLILCFMILNGCVLSLNKWIQRKCMVYSLATQIQVALIIRPTFLLCMKEPSTRGVNWHFVSWKFELSFRWRLPCWSSVGNWRLDLKGGVLFRKNLQWVDQFSLKNIFNLFYRYSTPAVSSRYFFLSCQLMLLSLTL